MAQHHKYLQAIGQQWFYGGILSIRHRSEWVTFQPLYFGLNQDAQPARADWYPTSEAAARTFRNVHTAGGSASTVLHDLGRRTITFNMKILRRRRSFLSLNRSTNSRSIHPIFGTGSRVRRIAGTMQVYSTTRQRLAMPIPIRSSVRSTTYGFVTRFRT